MTFITLATLAPGVALPPGSQLPRINGGRPRTNDTTRYQGLELSVRRRLARRVAYSASYTRSRLIDDGSSVFDASVLTGPIANYPMVLNTPNFGAPNAVLGAANFGTITTAFDPRVIQLALKLSF